MKHRRAHNSRYQVYLVACLPLVLMLIAFEPLAQAANGACDDSMLRARANHRESVEQILQLERGCRKQLMMACRELRGLLGSLQPCLGRTDSDAASVIDRACDSGSGEACLTKAEYVASRWKHPSSSGRPNARVTEALGRAYADYVRACNQAQPRGCAYAGWLLRDGIGVQAEPVRGSKILKKVCDDYLSSPRRVESSAEACQILASSYETGTGVNRDLRVARELRHQLCRSEGVGCEQLFLIKSWPVRVLAWILQGAVLLVANLLAAISLSRSNSAAVAVRMPVIIVCTAASLAAGIELAYYFWGSEWSSILWLLAALPPMILPSLAGMRERQKLVASA